MSRISGESTRLVLNESFICVHCGRSVSGDAPGTRQRNHCPECLHSRHVDLAVGDRRSGCRGAMEPVAVWCRSGEWVLIHRCEKCGFLRSNRIAGDDSEAALLELAAKPFEHAPFPVDRTHRKGDAV